MAEPSPSKSIAKPPPIAIPTRSSSRVTKPIDRLNYSHRREDEFKLVVSRRN